MDDRVGDVVEDEEGRDVVDETVRAADTDGNALSAVSKGVEMVVEELEEVLPAGDKLQFVNHTREDHRRVKSLVRVLNHEFFSELLGKPLPQMPLLAVMDLDRVLVRGSADEVDNQVLAGDDGIDRLEIDGPTDVVELLRGGEVGLELADTGQKLLVRQEDADM